MTRPRPEPGSNPEAVKLGNAIRELRRRHDEMTQTDLIRLAQIDRGVLQDVETGRRVPRAGNLRKIAAVFDLDIAGLRAFAEQLARPKPAKARRTSN